MEQASLVVGEINDQIPRTFGDTYVPVTEFHHLVESTEPPIYFDPWPMDDIFDKVAANVANVVEDGSCVAFSIGTLFEHLSKHLMCKRDLGIHSPFFSDNTMNLVKSGAVTNRRKATFRGKSVTSYAFGTPELMQWLDRNPLIEFQSTDLQRLREAVASEHQFRVTGHRLIITGVCNPCRQAKQRVRRKVDQI